MTETETGQRVCGCLPMTNEVGQYVTGNTAELVCGVAATEVVVSACRHEHVEQVGMCAQHAGEWREAFARGKTVFCVECYARDGHLCEWTHRWEAVA